MSKTRLESSSASAKSFSTSGVPFFLVRSEARCDTSALAFFHACLSPGNGLVQNGKGWPGCSHCSPPSILAKCSSWWISALFRWRLSLYLYIYIYSSYMQRFETLHESLLQPACSMAIFKSIVSFGLFWLALDRNFRRATCEKRNK